MHSGMHQWPRVDKFVMNLQMYRCWRMLGCRKPALSILIITASQHTEALERCRRPFACKTAPKSLMVSLAQDKDAETFDSKAVLNGCDCMTQVQSRRHEDGSRGGSIKPGFLLLEPRPEQCTPLWVGLSTAQCHIEHPLGYDSISEAPACLLSLCYM